MIEKFDLIVILSVIGIALVSFIMHYIQYKLNKRDVDRVEKNVQEYIQKYEEGDDAK